jgi:hypothetical protein
VILPFLTGCFSVLKRGCGFDGGEDGLTELYQGWVIIFFWQYLLTIPFESDFIGKLFDQSLVV